ncbi:amidohydrolase [Halobacteriales archaeon QS_3_64_16]|nr:MAG: amidohydrolase [Halobacteriales archaeon QS_3_64_16]
MSQVTERSHLSELRRDLHQRPELAWREFYTTSRIIDELERIGVDELYYGKDALAPEHRMAVPNEGELEASLERAREAGARSDVLEAAAGGYTGAVAVLEQGEGPTIGLRVDIDGLPRAESQEEGHLPVREEFRSLHDERMHACGHDAHVATGIGVLEALKESDFSGTLKVFFQPGEEQVAGGKAMAESGHLEDVEYLFAIHVGLDHPTGEVVAGVDGFLAVSGFLASFSGTPAHAGGKPNEGRNAVQAMADAISALYAIPRHEDGPTRVNAGRVGGGTASNIVPEEAFIEGEVRGQTTELMEYMSERATRVLRGAAETHSCSVSIANEGEAPSAESDAALADLVLDAAQENDAVDTPTDRDTLGGSEDATYLMRKVQENGGEATYVAIGTDHPGGHHTANFDVDERSIDIGVDVLTESILDVASSPP